MFLASSTPELRYAVLQLSTYFLYETEAATNTLKCCYKVIAVTVIEHFVYGFVILAVSEKYLDREKPCWLSCKSGNS